MFRRLLRWVDDQTELITLFRRFMEEPLALGVGWPHIFGSVALFLFITQLATGILLMVYYVPSPDAAYQSTAYLDTRLPFGGFVRSLHHWGASAMLIGVFVHMLQAFFWGAYKRPRQIIWVIGVFLLLATLGLSFTGYLLPWDQKAYWATVVGTRIAGSIPVLGPYVTTIIRGGPDVGALTLTRFFGLHVMIFPALLIGLIVFHISQVRRQGITAPWRRVGEEASVPHPGLFYPDQVFKDAVAALVVLAVLFAIALRVPAPLESIANPASTGYKPRPEWYFLPNFQLLTYIPTTWGEWGEFFGALVVPALVVIALILLPYLDHNPERAPRRRPLVSTAALLALGSLLYLGVAGAQRGPKPVTLTPTQRRGEKVFLDLRCQSCHGINGGGGMEGVDLAEGGPRNPRAVEDKLTHPTRTNARSIMPPVPPSLSHSDLRDLVAYVSAIDSRFQMPSELAGLFPSKPISHYQQNWFANHRYEVLKDPTVCEQCHKPSFCQSCHRNRRPDSHLHDWLKYHYGTARERPAYCQVCHEQTFCNSCHSKALHTGDWMQRHGKVADSGDELCLECHTATGCTTCHGGAKPASHSNPNWVHAHAGSQVKQCQTCHTAEFCVTCHKGARPKSHDATWVARHGAVAKPDPQACATCHRATFCQDCHGGVTMPHPSNWVTAHKDTARFGPGSACYRCHDYAKLCSQCHGETVPQDSKPAS
ncbi:MAG: cytochrome b N-terminal domain-containing protein [Armatimonadota bacterium]